MKRTVITFVRLHSTPLAISGLHPRFCPPCWEPLLARYWIMVFGPLLAPVALFLADPSSLSVPCLALPASHTHPPVFMKIPAVALVTFLVTFSAWVLVNTFSFEMIFLRVPFLIFLNFDYLPDFFIFAYSMYLFCLFFLLFHWGPLTTLPHPINFCVRSGQSDMPPMGTMGERVMGCHICTRL